MAYIYNIIEIRNVLGFGFELLTYHDILHIFSLAPMKVRSLTKRLKIKYGTREGVNFLSVYSVSPEAVGRWPGGYKATV